MSARIAFEIVHGYSLRFFSSQQEDGLKDGDEVDTHNTDPFDADTDVSQLYLRPSKTAVHTHSILEHRAIR